MVKLFLTIIIGVFICGICQIFFPWWIFSIVIFLIYFIIDFKSCGRSFLGGLLITFITWVALYFWFNSRTDYIISNKLAEVFFVNNAILLTIIIALLMGVIGGLFGLSGYMLRKAFS